MSSRGITGCIYTLFILSTIGCSIEITRQQRKTVNDSTNIKIKFMKMYKSVELKDSQIERNEGYIGESLEKKVARILSNNEPITDGAPTIYTERKAGVQPSYNIRTDRFEVAVEAMDGISRQHVAKREERAKVIEMKQENKDGGAEPIQGTNE